MKTVTHWSQSVLLLCLCAIALCDALAPIVSEPHEDTIDQSYFVVLKNDANLHAHLAWFDDLHRTLRFSHPLIAESSGIAHRYSIGKEFKAYAAVLHPSLLQSVRAHPSVDYIERNAICSTAISTTKQANVKWNLARIGERTLTSPYTYVFPSSAGAGVTNYVLDTGVDTNLTDFGGRVAHGVSFVSGEGIGDYNGHGTHVAGIIASKTYGVAKASKIVSVKVLPASGKGSWSNVLAGLQWIVNKKKTAGITIANLSLVGAISTVVNHAMAAATNAGVHVVVAAGNSGQNACTFSPGSAGGSVITVGSSNVKDAVSAFSNYGKCVDIYAPGETIVSLKANAPGKTLVMSGTSMASPHVAGVIALTLSDIGRDASPAAVKRAVVDSMSTKNVLTNVNMLGGSNYLLFDQRILGMFIDEVDTSMSEEQPLLPAPYSPEEEDTDQVVPEPIATDADMVEIATESVPFEAEPQPAVLVDTLLHPDF